MFPIDHFTTLTASLPYPLSRSSPYLCSDPVPASPFWNLCFLHPCAGRQWTLPHLLYPPLLPRRLSLVGMDASPLLSHFHSPPHLWLSPSCRFPRSLSNFALVPLLSSCPAAMLALIFLVPRFAHLHCSFLSPVHPASYPCFRDPLPLSTSYSLSLHLSSAVSYLLWLSGWFTSPLSTGFLRSFSPPRSALGAIVYLLDVALLLLITFLALRVFRHAASFMIFAHFLVFLRRLFHLVHHFFPCAFAFIPFSTGLISPYILTESYPSPRFSWRASPLHF